MKKILIFALNLMLISCSMSKHEQYDPYKVDGSDLDSITNATSFDIAYKETESNVKTIHVKLNDVASFDAIFDTGCSGMVISYSEIDNLLKEGTISKNDFLGESMATIADGSAISNIVLNMSEVSIIDVNGKSHSISNVPVQVMENISAPVLIGNTIINEWAKRGYTVDFKTKTIRFL